MLPRNEHDAHLDLREAEMPLLAAPSGPPALRLASVAAWLDDGAPCVTLRGADPHNGGEIDLVGLTARLQARPSPGSAGALGLESFTLLTISAALLLSRMRGALMHAAAVAAPDGRAWLLVGDARSGKTTTTLNLVRQRWGYLSDDHVVLFPAAEGDGVVVHGWPRIFHVDEGWERGEVTGRRVDFDPAGMESAWWVPSAPLGGILFPRVEAAERTGLRPLSPGDALARMARQSPWFLADRAAAPSAVALLERVAGTPAFDLVLGRDSYRDSSLLRGRLGPLFSA
jgi:hypothetical protein